jgi:molecular chaperone GrpE
MKNPYANMSNDLFSDTPAWTKPDHAPQQKPPAAEPVMLDNLESLCRESICPTCPTRAEADDLHLRGLAEMENFKRRLQREAEEKEKYAGEAVLADLLPTLDSLDLAIQYAQDKNSTLLQGVIMTRKLLLDALKPHGLHPVGEQGEAFDPELHEALGEEECGDLPPLHIACLMQHGYKLKDRLLRPAKVMVSRAPS